MTKSKFTKQYSDPLHIENTVNKLATEDLRLPKAFKTYRSMLSDEIIGGAMGLVKSLINKADYALEIPENASEDEKKLIKALNQSLENLEGMTKSEFINYVLSELDYGNSVFELVMHRVEGRQVFKTFSPIHPINIKRYTYQRNSLEKVELSPPENDGELIKNQAMSTEIDGKKILMFRVNPDLDNPLGQSLLARCYKPWKKKEIASEYELIGVAKNLSGVLKIKAPSEYINDYYNDPTSANAMYMEEVFEQAEMIHGGKSSFAVIASDTNDVGQRLFDIETIGNSSGNTEVDTNKIISRYETSILMTLYSDLLSLGQNGGGSFALSDSKSTLLTLVVKSILNGITQNFEKAVKVAYNLNALAPQDGYPKLKFDDVEKLDFETFSRGWQRLVKDGIVEVDQPLEAWIRKRSGAPIKDYETTRKVVDVDTGNTDDNERDDKEA